METARSQRLARRSQRRRPAGNDPRASAPVSRGRRRDDRRGASPHRNWAREHPGQRDEAWFKREIVAEARRVHTQGDRQRPRGCRSRLAAECGRVQRFRIRGIGGPRRACTRKSVGPDAAAPGETLSREREAATPNASSHSGQGRETTRSTNGPIPSRFGKRSSRMLSVTIKH